MHILKVEFKTQRITARFLPETIKTFYHDKIKEDYIESNTVFTSGYNLSIKFSVKTYKYSIENIHTDNTMSLASL